MKTTRKLILSVWLTLLFVGIAFLFWENEYKYSLPTPLPINYKDVTAGTFIRLNKAGLDIINGKPTVLHFFNPACPCSRFNITHVQSLVRKYSEKINFAIVVISKKQYSVTDIQEQFGLNVPVYFDSTIAAACGVYATPQAVILTPQHTLYYRGNYNKSRYCTDTRSYFAEIALDSLFRHITLPKFNSLALTAYGCALPVCEKK